MQSRKQLILQQLGVQQWLPRSQLSQAANVSMMWRDGVGSLEQTPIIATDMSQQTQMCSTASSVEQPKLLTKVSQYSLEGAVDQLEVRQITDQVSVNKHGVSSSQHLTDLDYQVLLHDQFVIVAKVENNQQMQLFKNITVCCTAAQQHLIWPLAINSWDMQDVLLDIYLQGFFYGQQHKQLIVLGDCVLNIDQLGFSQSLKLDSVRQLLASAEAKSALWEQLYPHIY